MIIEQNDLVNYENQNKIYIPNGYINNNWKYNFNGDYIIIRSNQNCYTQYNTQYCTCYAYNYKTNVISEGYECNYTSNSNQTIAITSISNDINDSGYIRERFIQEKGIMLAILGIGVIIAILLTRRSNYR